MMDYKFKDEEHEEGFKTLMKRAKASPKDTERVSLFYVLALFRETRNYIDDLYDFEYGHVKFEGLNTAWQTGGTTKATKLAFNLFNGWRGEDREIENYSPLELFSVSSEYRNYLLHAVQIRFS